MKQTWPINIKTPRGGIFFFFFFLLKIPLGDLLSAPFYTQAETKILLLLSALAERFGREICFSSGWQWLTTSAHNQKLLKKTKISDIRSNRTNLYWYFYQSLYLKKNTTTSKNSITQKMMLYSFNEASLWLLQKAVQMTLLFILQSGKEQVKATQTSCRFVQK